MTTASMELDLAAQSDRRSSGPLALWRAVIQQAIKDGTNNKTTDARECRAREAARLWFRQRGPNFRQVCELADYDQHWLANKALALFDKADRENPPRNHAAPHDGRKDNGRIPRRFEHNGRILTLKEWAGATGVGLKTLQSRIYTSGWSIERALTEPSRDDRKRGSREANDNNAPGAGSMFPEQPKTGTPSPAQD